MGVFQNHELLDSWRISTSERRTEDEFMVLLHNLLAASGHQVAEIDGMIVCSVVPGVTQAFKKLVKKYLSCPAYYVDHTAPTGLRIAMDNPAEVGADRIVNALAGYRQYGTDLIIVDFGTATTFDCVSRDGTYLGGAICPGFDISKEALFLRAAKLANIDLYRPPAAIGHNTADCLRSGILLGYGGMVDSLVARMKAEFAASSAVRVIGTGGLATFVRGFCSSMDEVDVMLTLKGLDILWDIVQAQ